MRSLSFASRPSRASFASFARAAAVAALALASLSTAVGCAAAAGSTSDEAVGQDEAAVVGVPEIRFAPTDVTALRTLGNGVAVSWQERGILVLGYDVEDCSNPLSQCSSTSPRLARGTFSYRAPLLTQKVRVCSYLSTPSSKLCSPIVTVNNIKFEGPITFSGIAAASSLRAEPEAVDAHEARPIGAAITSFPDCPQGWSLCDDLSCKPHPALCERRGR